jgi:cell division protein FtsW
VRPAPRVHPAFLLAAAAVLFGVGLLVIDSGAATPAARRFGKTAEDYLVRQTNCVLLGIALLTAIARFGGGWMRRLAGPAVWVMVLLCALTLIPGVGITHGGARRHVALLDLVFQPTILLCALAPVCVAAILCRGPEWKHTLLVFALLLAGGVICLRQPNFGHLATLLATVLGTLIGLGRRRLAVAVGGLLAAAAPLALCFPYVRWRLRSFLEPGLTRDTLGLQAIAADATALGKGLGNGWEKAWLSAAHTDYAFAVTLEELGWFGAGAVLVLVLLLAAGLWRGAFGSPYARGVATGCAAFVAFPALVHAAVCLRLVPVTGIHLPLVSYSGSAALAVFVAMGTVLSAHTEHVAPSPPRRAEGRGSERRDELVCGHP